MLLLGLWPRRGGPEDYPPIAQSTGLCSCSAFGLAEGAPSYDFARQMEGATEVKCSGFADVIIANL